MLRKLKYAHLLQRLLTNLYRSTIESILTYCCTVWFSSCTEANRKALERVVKAAERTIGSALPLLRDIYSGPLQKKASPKTTLTLDIDCLPYCLLGKDTD